jgi:glycosyltransferase involved in cell wall biosynthesis
VSAHVPQFSPEASARRLHILAISSDTFPPRRVDVRVLFGDELTRRGHRTDWILQSEADCERAYVTHWGESIAWVGNTDNGMSLLSRIRKHVRGILNDTRVLSLVHRATYDIVLVKDKFISGLTAMVAARLSGTPFVYWLSWPYPEEYATRATDGTARYPTLYAIRGRIFKFLLYRLLLPAADHIMVQSEQMRRDIAAQGIPLSKMTAVPMGVRVEDHASVNDCSESRVIPEGIRCFLYLGTLSKVRRLDFLVHVLVRVRAVVPDAMLYFVGQGDDAGDEQFLRDEAVRLGVENAVVLTGQLTQQEAFAYVRDADVCVSPFYPTPILNSTSPTKLVEYLALGKPVVANDHPEQRQVIEDSRAGLCVAYDIDQFASAIIQLLHDPDGAAAMGSRGREYAVKNRSYGVIAGLVERCLAEVTARRPTKWRRAPSV